jgi:hypothetical protein
MHISHAGSANRLSGHCGRRRYGTNKTAFFGETPKQPVDDGANFEGTVAEMHLRLCAASLIVALR